MTTVREFLTQAKDERRRLFFRPELGNAGDALINAGFYTLARRLGLDYVEITGGRRAVPELGREDLLILAGGGSLSSHWDIGEQTLDSLTCFDVPLLLLPQSLQGRENVLARLREQDTLFVREEYSLRYARSLHLACPVHLDHDMALSLDTALVLATPVRHLPRSRDDLRRAAAFARHRVRARRGLPLTAWRSDSEATSDRQARRRDDLSALGPETLGAALQEAGSVTVDGGTPTVAALLQQTGLVSSLSEARRTVKEGGAYLNNERVTDADTVPGDGDWLPGGWLVLRRGKRSVAGVRRGSAQVNGV